MVALRIGYVDVVTDYSTSPTFATYPLDVEVAFGSTPPWWEHPDDPASLGPLLTFLATNSLTVGTAGRQLFIGAAVRKADASGQTLEVGIVGADDLLDAQVTVRINTSIDTMAVDYTAKPSPKRGESFVIVGTSSPPLGLLPRLDFIVGLDKNPDPAAVDPDSVTHVSVRGDLGQPTSVIVGQRRQRTAASTFTDPNLQYRRAIGADSDPNLAGLLMSLTVQNGDADLGSWVHVDVTQPDQPDGPAQAPLVADAGSAGAIPIGAECSYQVAWLHGTWSGSTYTVHRESSPSPASAAVSTTSGAIKVPLPSWEDPHDPELVPPTPPEQVVGWRVYRTVSGTTASGDAYLVHEEPAPQTSAGQPVPGHDWVDTTADGALTIPALSSLTIAVVNALDYQRTNLAAGFINLNGELLQASYEEAPGGSPQFRGTRYTINVSSAPPLITVDYTTRPAAGSPRVTWKSSDANGPSGVGSATVRVAPTGVAVNSDQTIDAALEQVPAVFGVDWFQRGADRISVEVGAASDTGSALDDGLGMIVARASLSGAPHPPSSTRTLNVDMLPDDLSFTARGLRRVRLLMGLPRPTDPINAVDGDGLVAELQLDPAGKRRARSLRVRRDTPDAPQSTGLTRVVARVGDLPDEVLIDMRPGIPFPDDGAATVPLRARLSGRLERIAVLYQPIDTGLAELPGDESRRDGAWVTLPASANQIDLRLDHNEVSVETSDPLRTDASVRSTAGLGTDTPIHLAQATLTAGRDVTVELPQTNGAMSITSADGVSGRAAISTRSSAPSADTLLAARATPQAKVTFFQPQATPGVAAQPDRMLRDLVVRWLGLKGLTKPPDASPPDFTGSFTDTRANKAFRAQAVLTDERLSPDPFLLARARVADVPETINLHADTDQNHYLVGLNRPSGRVLLVAQPPQVAIAGADPNRMIGLGFAKADIDGLPTSLELDVLGGSNPQQSQPFNSSPDSDWVRSGFRIKPSSTLTVRALQLISASYLAPPTSLLGFGPAQQPETAFWTNLAATVLQISSEDGSEPGPVWIWTPHQPLPLGSTSSSAWSKLKSWLGYRIESPSLVTLQIQPYEGKTTTIPERWSAGWSWLLHAEFQMKDYRGEVTVDGAFPTGDTDAGPGKWTLRVPDGIPPFNGQIVFGNTGGWFSNRPRVFPPFTPPINPIPTF